MQQIAPPPQPGNGSHSLFDDLRAWVGIVRRGWRLIVIGVLVALTCGGIYLARSKTTYRASARLLVLQQGGRPIQVAAGNSPLNNVNGPDESLSTHLLLIGSPAVVERAIELSDLGTVSAPSVIRNLTVRLPDAKARIVEINYKSGSRDEAKRLLDGVIESYNYFLKNHYQKSNNEVITLILKARDELNSELMSLERQYLAYRQKNPAYSADKEGRTFIARRLDQWDQAMNQVLTKSLQLKSQLDLGRKLADEGADEATLSSALNQLAVLGNGPQPSVLPQPQGGAPAAMRSPEQLTEELADAENHRKTAEQLLSHLRRGLEDLKGAAEVAEREIAEVFYEDREVAELQTRLQGLKSKLRETERLSRSPSDPSLVSYRKRIADLNEDLQFRWRRMKPVIARKLAGESSVAGAEAVRKAEADLMTAKAKEATLRDRLVQVTSQELERLEQVRERLKPVLSPTHPQLLHIEQRIARVTVLKDRPPAGQTGDGKAGVVLASVERSLQSIEAMRNDLQKKFDEDLNASKKTEIGQLEESNLRNNLERQRVLFNSVVDQLKQAQFGVDFGSVSAETINRTRVVEERPSLVMVLAVCLLFGCGLGAFAAYAADRLDARVRSLAEVRELLDLPVLGLIPQLPSELTTLNGSVAMLSHETPRSSIAESYKSTRTNLEFLRRNRRAQLLLVSSPHPGDGKTTTSSNLAITLAHAGRRVLLIDADLRKPSLHTIYNLSRDRGLCDALQNFSPVAALAQPTCVENLDVMTTGPDVSNPAELLAGPTLGELVDELRNGYDIVIFDSSPLLAVTDASIIASVVDGILLVVRIESTRRHDVERTTELLKTLEVPVLGMVVNGLTRHQVGYGYGYGYGYGNTGKPYGSSPDPVAPRNGPTARQVTTSPGVNGRVGFEHNPSEANT